jgi:hypothetical protein
MCIVVMLGGGRMEVLETPFMHAVVQAAVGGDELQAHALVCPVIGTDSDRIKIGQSPFNLFEDGYGIGSRVIPPFSCRPSRRKAGGRQANPGSCSHVK